MMDKKIKKNKKNRVAITKFELPHIEKIDERGNLKVWVVDGSYIRGQIDEEFTNFGQHYSFPYIPKNELWIEQETKNDERRFFIDHLLVEHRLMAKGIPYSRFDSDSRLQQLL